MAETTDDVSTDRAKTSFMDEVASRAIPRPGEEALWRWLDSLAVESARVRRDEANYDSFNHYLDIYYGKHWPSNLPSFRPAIVANELRTLCLSEASDLTESQLRIYITKDPKGSRDDAAERALRAIWAREQVDLKLLYACCWAEILGTAFLHVPWDPTAANGMGDVTVDCLDPRTVLPDPDAVDDEKWLYVIRETVLDLQEIRRLFPLSGYRVRPDDAFSIRDRSGGANPGGPTSVFYLGPLHEGLPPLPNGYKKARARVLDLLVRDDSIDEVVEEITNPDGTFVRDDSGQPILEAKRVARYPGGRRIVGANGVILFDGPNPNVGGDYGILRLVLEPALGRFWGTGFVQQTAELQLAADKLLSSIVENAIRLNNGVVISTTNTGLDWESFAGIPAQVVQINPGSSFEIKYPPPMPPDMIQAPWRMLDLQKRLLGFEGARSGQQSPGNVSAELTETEISQSQSPTRLRARLLYYTVQRLARMMFVRMLQGYTTPRVIPAVEGEQFKPVMWEPVADPSKYALYIDPASFTIMSRTMLRRMGLALYKLRAIDRRSLLETVGWPDWERVAKNLEQAEALSAMAKMKERKR